MSIADNVMWMSCEYAAIGLLVLSPAHSHHEQHFYSNSRGNSRGNPLILIPMHTHVIRQPMGLFVNTLKNFQ